MTHVSAERRSWIDHLRATIYRFLDGREAVGASIVERVALEVSEHEIVLDGKCRSWACA